MPNTSQHDPEQPESTLGKRYYRVCEVMERLDVSERTVRRWCKSGRIQWTKDRRGGLLISASDIEQERAKRAATPKPVSVVDLQREIADLQREVAECGALVDHLMEVIQQRTSG